MDNLLTIVFEAHSEEAIHHRHYQITVGRDLLDQWTVAIYFGRTGHGGRRLCFASPRPDDMRAVIRERLRRRLSAPKRIGCPYRLTTLNAAPGFDTLAWLPGKLMTRFFQPDERRSQAGDLVSSQRCDEQTAAHPARPHGSG